MPVAVGVDLGTTHCSIGVWHHDRPEIIANHHGLRATPTMVAFTDTEVLVGEAALTQMPKNIANTVFGFKWMVGQSQAQLEPHIKRMLDSAPFKCKFDGKNGAARVTVAHKGEDLTVGAETLCGHLFSHLRTIAEAFAGETIGKCVLSVPAGFTEEQREVLKSVGKQAGLPFSLVISDPVAAAVAYGLDRPDEEMGGSSREGEESKPRNTMVVVDWGGGGVEVSVLKRSDGILSVRGQASDPSIGGREFTNRLVAFCAKDFKRKTGGDIFESKRAILKVTRGCEEAVRTLSVSTQADVYVEAAHEGCDMSVKVSRTRFEDLCFDLYKACAVTVGRALEVAGVTAEGVDTVLMAGGIAQMPRVVSTVKAKFPGGTAFGHGLFPDEAVAIGATIQAYLVQEHASFLASGAAPLPRRIKTCPVSLGVWTGAEACAEGEDDPVVLIPQGCILPAQSSAIIRVLWGGVEEGGGGGGLGGGKGFPLHVVEVEDREQREDAEDWVGGGGGGTSRGKRKGLRVVGSLWFNMVPGGEEGVEVEVGFTLRSEGVLKVEALEMGTKALQELVIGSQ